MIDKDENRIFMSDSLSGMIPALEDQPPINLVEDPFIVAAIDFDFDLVTGSLFGLFQDEKGIKVDIQTSLLEAYEITKKFSSSRLSCRVLYLRLHSDEVCFEGPFGVASVQMTNLDIQSKICTLGVDLIRVPA